MMVGLSLSLVFPLLLHLASPAPAPAEDAKEVAQVHSPALGEVVQVVPEPNGSKSETKRAALLLDKIMFAVQKALDEKEKPGAGGKKGGAAANINLASFTGPGMERRGSSHDRVY